GKIASALLGRRHRERDQIVERTRALKLEVGKEEQLVVTSIEFSWDIHWSAKREPFGAIPVSRAGKAVVVVDPRIGVHPLIAQEEIGAAVKFIGAALGDDRDVGTCRAAKLRL